MKILNPQGRIVSVNQDFYSRYITKQGWEPVDSEKSSAVDSKDSSTDYTIAELRELKPDVEYWESFIEGDERKSVHSL